MMNLLQMKMIYPNMISDNIMSDLSDFSVPWSTEQLNTSLDLGYYTQSGQKNIAPFLYDILDGAETLTTANRTKVAGMVFKIFNRKWTRLWDANIAEYNPISNYDMVENETINDDKLLTGSNTGTINIGNTGTVTNQSTHTGTDTIVTDKDNTNTGTQQNSGTSGTSDGIFGFNSSDAVGNSTSDETSSNTRTDNLASTEDITETETKNLSDSNTETLNTVNLETRNLANSETVNTDVERELTRSGNIGVTTTQQMLTSEIELWQWNFFKQVFDDIDSICCLDIY